MRLRRCWQQLLTHLYQIIQLYSGPDYILPQASNCFGQIASLHIKIPLYNIIKYSKKRPLIKRLNIQQVIMPQIPQSHLISLSW